MCFYKVEDIVPLPFISACYFSNVENLRFPVFLIFRFFSVRFLRRMYIRLSVANEDFRSNSVRLTHTNAALQKFVAYFGANRNEMCFYKVEDIVPLPFIILYFDAKRKLTL